MSGSTIGGAVGAVVGSFIPGVGTQVGFMIGSAIGGYIDPMKVKGPQLRDAMTQTSTVGIPLPFGYGTFPTAGNVIWAGPLVEHVKRERQGKGGGVKTTTYTYTRSYAIGVCEGPISGFLWIKRNGKTVYTSDPNAPAKERAYAEQWLKKATLYVGGEDQMPDSTIEADKGVGNVAAFRGLAYVVIENDDLTELGGAVPQYEFVVQVGAAKSYTTPPYPVFTQGSLGVSQTPGGGGVQGWPVDDLGVGVFPLGGQIRNVLVYYDAQPEGVGAALEVFGGRVQDVVLYVTMNSEPLGILGVEPKGGGHKLVVLTYENYAPESVGTSIAPLGGVVA